jgi:hypothetical protein
MFLSTSGVVSKLDGTPYTNTDEDWLYMSEVAAKAARWLGLESGGVPLFERIIDERNEQPYIYIPETYDPNPIVSAGSTLELELPESPVLEFDCNPWPVIQPNRIVMVGEKVSLKEVLDPIAKECETELVLPTGELSDTLVYNIAKRASEDDRPLVVLYFSDFDLSGYAMVTTVARKLQAFRDLYFEDLDIQVHQVALTLSQVQRLGLPSTPLKETEKRADRWKTLMGHEQTEIDALSTLNPQELARIARKALEPFYDFDLADAVAEAEEEWREEARKVIEAHPEYANALARLERTLEGLKKISGFYASAQSNAEEKLADAEPPEIELPEPCIIVNPPEPVYSSACLTISFVSL